MSKKRKSSTMVFHLKYFQAAEIDLKAAKILVKENLFPPTLYYLQQAYEKCIKSYYIFRDSTNAVKEEERGRDPNLLDALYLLDLIHQSYSVENHTGISYLPMPIYGFNKIL